MSELRELTYENLHEDFGCSDMEAFKFEENRYLVLMYMTANTYGGGVWHYVVQQRDHDHDRFPLLVGRSIDQVVNNKSVNSPTEKVYEIHNRGRQESVPCDLTTFSAIATSYLLTLMWEEFGQIAGGSIWYDMYQGFRDWAYDNPENGVNVVALRKATD